jgi:hypothetical protein
VTVVNADHWKLYLYHEEWQLDGGRARIDTNRAVELYDLRSDLGERDDLSQSHPEKRDELLAMMHEWFQQTGGRLPDEPNSNYRPNGKNSVGQ